MNEVDLFFLQLNLRGLLFVLLEVVGLLLLLVVLFVVERLESPTRGLLVWLMLKLRVFRSFLAIKRAFSLAFSFVGVPFC